jgi:hypothetical protein
MLTIRTQQIQILEEARRRRFVDEMAAHLSRCFAGKRAVADPDRLRATIGEGVEAAQKYGIVSRDDLRRYLEFRTEYGPDFEQLPWAARILNDPTLSGSGKVEQIDDYSLYRLRPAANG